MPLNQLIMRVANYAVDDNIMCVLICVCDVLVCVYISGGDEEPEGGGPPDASSSGDGNACEPELDPAQESDTESYDVNASIFNEEPFSLEEELLFERRFEEDFDLPDTRYDAWLNLYHPEACISTVPESLSTSPLLFQSLVQVTILLTVFHPLIYHQTLPLVHL